MRSSLTPESEFESPQAGIVARWETTFQPGFASVELARGAVHSHHIKAGDSIQITATSGTGWITLEGDPEDYVLECGATSIFTGPGLLVIEGLMEVNSFTVAGLHIN